MKRIEIDMSDNFLNSQKSFLKNIKFEKQIVKNVLTFINSRYLICKEKNVYMYYVYRKYSVFLKRSIINSFLSRPSFG